jgi:hypothetical protein
MLYNTPGGKRPVDKPKRRWIEAVEQDCKKTLGTCNWKTEAMNRQVWQGYLQEAKTQCRAVVP